MSKGELPVPYLIAIVVGIIVIGILVYMFITKTGIFQGFTLEQECRAKLHLWCSKWELNGWSSDWEQKNPFASGGGNVNVFAPECSQFSWAHVSRPEDCQKILGIKTTVT